MISNQDYAKLVEKFQSPSKTLRNMIYAFLIGGAICTIGQVVMNIAKNTHYFAKDEISSITAMTMIFLGALLTGLKWYEKIAKIGGAGTLVPITGFSNAIVSPAMEFKAEGIILGMGAKMFTIAGPVLVFGTIASIVYGIIFYIVKLFW